MGFVEGARLFNTGKYWEAHEAWEDVWRGQKGGARIYVQAFLQMAAAYSFVRLAKLQGSRYLFEKALEKFERFRSVDVGLPLDSLVDGMGGMLAQLDSIPANGRYLLTPSQVPNLDLPGL